MLRRQSRNLIKTLSSSVFAPPHPHPSSSWSSLPCVPLHRTSHVYHRTMSATTNVTSQNKNETDFPIDVGKSLRVMNLNKGQIIVKNLDPGDERVELSSSSSRLNAEKAENNT